MRKLARTLILALAACAGPALAAGDPLAGQAKARDSVCVECHLADGNSTQPDYPKLAGQSAAYIVKQLRDFQAGTRKHQIMQAMTQGLGEADMADIAAWFASNPAMRGSGVAANSAGRRLFAEGDAQRDIPACAACHGTSGKGGLTGAQAYPAVGGQHRFYLRGQLQDWKSATRRNSPDGVMNTVAGALSDADIEALSEYLSTL